MLRDDARQLTQNTIADLSAIGSQERVFGRLDSKGLIAKGPLQGLALNDVRTYPERYATRTTHIQKQWIRTANNIEKAKLAYLKNNGIQIPELTFAEGGQYAGRRLLGKFTRDGELIDIGYIGAGPSPLGKKLAQEKMRVFDTAEEGIAEGYRYIPEDEALQLNVEGAYNRVADKRMSEWLLHRVPWRTTAAPEEFKAAVYSAQRKVESLERVSSIAQRASRGESPPGAAIGAIRRTNPEFAERIDDALAINIDHINAAIQRMPAEVFEYIKTTKPRFVEALQNVRFQRGTQTAGNTITPSELVSVTASLGVDERRSYNMLKSIYRNASRHELEQRSEALAQRHQTLASIAHDARSALADAKLVAAKAVTQKAHAREWAQKLHGVEEGQLRDIPAFKGKIFTGKEARETTRILREGLEPTFSEALDRLNQANSVMRYFTLAGDASPMMIQLLYLMGADPKSYLQAGRGFIRAVFDPEFHGKYLAHTENKAISQKYPNIILSQGGATEFTEAMGRGGLLRTGPLKLGGKILQPFQRGFEGALDVAGLEMAKSLDHLGTTAARREDLGQFINEFRGITSSARLGVSAGQRQRETLALLAPRYNRAIAALMFDTVHGGLRGDLARKALAKGIAAIATMGVLVSAIKGEDEDEILGHLNPGSPTFMTWKVGDQNVGPGSKLRSVINLVAKSAKNPNLLADTSVGWGTLEYMKNPILKFGRGTASPIVTNSFDLATGKDYIGDPTRDGLLSFSEQVAKNFMPIWVETVAMEGGSVADRTTRGIAEFFGGRSYQRNKIVEAMGDWRSELNLYKDIPKDAIERKAKGIRSPSQYRDDNPTIDAKLFITGEITSIRSPVAANRVLRMTRERGIDPTNIRAVKSYLEEQKQREELGVELDIGSKNQRLNLELIRYLLQMRER